MARERRADKAQEWTDRFRRFNATDNHTIVEFCRAEQVSIASFYRWRKKLAGTPETPRARRPISVSETSGFRELKVVPQPGGHAITIRLPSGISLELGVDLAVIEKVVTQLFDRHDRTVLGTRQTAGGGPC